MKLQGIKHPSIGGHGHKINEKNGSGRDGNFFTGGNRCGYFYCACGGNCIVGL